MILFMLPGGALVAFEGEPTRRVPPPPRPPKHPTREAALSSAGLKTDRVYPAPDERAVQMAGDMIDVAAGRGDEGDCKEEDLLRLGWTREAIRIHYDAALRIAHGKAGTAR